MRLVILATTVLSLWACENTPPDQTPPTLSATPFLESVTAADSALVYRGVFTADGDSFLYFTGELDDNAKWRMHAAKKIGREWRYDGPIIVGGEHPDLYPSVSPDGDRIVFSSYRDWPGGAGEQSNANLWYADRLPDGGWGMPVFIKNASTIANYDSGPLIQHDLSITFHSTEPDWITQHTRITKWNGTEYGGYETLDDVSAIETWSPWADGARRIWGAALSPDGSIIVIEAGEFLEGSQTAPSALWLSILKDSQWSPPVRLPESIDTRDQTENFLTYDPTGERLYFVRDFKAFHSVAVDDLRLWAHAQKK